MANSGKNQQNLSPENYIRQKVRNLPVTRCMVNESWKILHVANVMVAREHLNGHFTVAFFFVDLACMGVKDTAYFFNLPLAELDEIIKEQEQAEKLVEIEYDLAHNIVFAGLEFAQDLGFKPHKDFAVSRFILEEDDENIPLVDVETGIDGQAIYMYGKNTPKAELERVIDTLSFSCGVGNFDIVNVDDEEEDELDNDLFKTIDLGPDFKKDEDDDSISDFLANEYRKMVELEADKRKDLFYKYLDFADKYEDNLYYQRRLELLVEAITTYEICNQEKLDLLIDSLKYELTYPLELTGSKSVASLLDEQYEIIDNWAVTDLDNENSERPATPPALNELFNAGEVISIEEMIQYQELKIFYYSHVMDFEMIDAIEETLFDLDIDYEDKVELSDFLYIQRNDMLERYWM